MNGNINTLMEVGKVPPQATDVESAVLGALILEAHAFVNVQHILKKESFYKPEHQIIYEALMSLHRENKPIDLLTVTAQLHNSSSLEAAGGALYVTKLTNGVASAAHIEHHARIIAQKHMQRELIRISSAILGRAYDDQEDIDDLLAFAREKIQGIENITNCEGKTSVEVAVFAVKEIEKDCERTKNGEPPGIPTGFIDLNKAIGGWKVPYFIVQAARPGEGKTSLALWYAQVAARAGFWVNFYSYEMRASDLFKIAISGVSGINRTSIRDGLVKFEEWADLHSAVGQLEQLTILWYDSTNIKASTIQANTFKNKRKGMCDLVIVDYLQLVPSEDKKHPREQQVAEISRILKQTSFEVPIIACAQLNREVDKRSSPEPVLADLRESGAIEQDADIVIFPYSEKDMDGNINERILKVAKNRNGNIGKIKFRANREMTAFYDVASYDIPDFKPEENKISHPDMRIEPNNNFDNQPF